MLTHVSLGKNVVHVFILHLNLPDNLAVVLSFIQPPATQQQVKDTQTDGRQANRPDGRHTD